LIAKTGELVLCWIGVIEAVETAEGDWNEYLIKPTDTTGLIGVWLSGCWAQGTYTIVESIARKTDTSSSTILLIH
jgi:hypothetical protein